MLDVKEMDLRDWFAGQVLNALILKHHTEGLPDSPFQQHHHAHTAVHEAYVYADEMMRERARRSAEAT